MGGRRAAGSKFTLLFSMAFIITFYMAQNEFPLWPPSIASCGPIRKVKVVTKPSSPPTAAAGLEIQEAVRNEKSEDGRTAGSRVETFCKAFAA
jgi:hypothetical protein